MKKIVFLILTVLTTNLVNAEIRFNVEKSRMEIYWDYEDNFSKIDGLNLYKVHQQKKIKINKEIIAPGVSFEKILFFRDEKTYNDLIDGPNTEISHKQYLEMFESMGERRAKDINFLFGKKAEALYAGIGYWDYEVELNQQYSYELYEVIKGIEKKIPFKSYNIDTTTKILPLEIQIDEAKRVNSNRVNLSWSVSKKEMDEKGIKSFNVLTTSPKEGMVKKDINIFNSDKDDKMVFYFMDGNAVAEKTAYYLEAVLKSHHRGQVKMVMIPASLPDLPNVENLKVISLPQGVNGAHLTWNFSKSELSFGGFKIERFKKGEKKPEMTKIIEDTYIREYAEVFDGKQGEEYVYKVSIESNDGRFSPTPIETSLTIPRYFELFAGPTNLKYEIVEKNERFFAVFTWEKSKAEGVKGYVFQRYNPGFNTWVDEKKLTADEKLTAEVDITSYDYGQTPFCVYAFGEFKRSNSLVVDVQTYSFRIHKPDITRVESVNGFLKVSWSHNTQLGIDKGFRIYDSKDQLILDEKLLPAGLNEAYIPGIQPNESIDTKVSVIYGEGKEKKNELYKTSRLEYNKYNFNGSRDFNQTTAKRKNISTYFDLETKKNLKSSVEYLEDEKGIKVLDGKKVLFNRNQEKVYEVIYKNGKLDGIQRYINPLKISEIQIHLFIDGKQVSLTDYEKSRGKLSLSEEERKMIVNPEK